MKLGNYGERYDVMPITPVEENMERFQAGAITIGVEYRVLTNEIIMASKGHTRDGIPETLRDNGVSLHVFAKAGDGDLERLRFDCFEEEPHYHYISWPSGTQDIVHVDPTTTGDILVWALGLIRTRLPQMLLRAGIESAGQLVELERVEQVLPIVTEAAFRLRYHTDDRRIEEQALAAGRRSQQIA